MADAKPSRPGQPYSQAPSKMEINIPVAVGEQIIKKADGSVVSRVEFTTGSSRENILFAKDHPNAKTIEEIEAAKPQTVDDGWSTTKPVSSSAAAILALPKVVPATSSDVPKPSAPGPVPKPARAKRKSGSK